MEIRSKIICALMAASIVCGARAEYNVRQPSNEIRPVWFGARPGQWTMDYKAAFANAKAAGKCTLLFVTGSWWCPHCEAFEEKVLLSSVWKNFITEQGFYLAMLDFPYRGTVKDEELYKCAHPELGPGWGFKCWLYDKAYLSANGLTEQDGLREIQKRYEFQKTLATSDASLVSIKTWDGKNDFTYGKVGYPTIVVYLPDGSEAGRFVPFVTYMDAEEARKYVTEQIDAIASAALESKCGLCSESDRGGLEGAKAQTYLAYLKNDKNEIAGTATVTTSKRSTKGIIRIKAVVTIDGKKTTLNATTPNGYETIRFSKSGPREVSAGFDFGVNGLSGTFTDGTSTYAVIGARNAFIAKDADAVSHVSTYETGTWGMAVSSEKSGFSSQFTSGYGALSVTLKGKGKAKVMGSLSDGTKVNVTGQVIPGEGGVSCLPVIARLYSRKKGGIRFNLWFKNGLLFNVTDVSAWHVAGKNESTINWRPLISAKPGFSGIDSELELLFNEVPTSVMDMELAIDPNGDLISIEGKKWTGTMVVTDFSARFNDKTGVLSGKMFFYAYRESGKTKKISSTVTGVVVDGKVYATVLLKKYGTWGVKLLSCAACDE